MLFFLVSFSHVSLPLLVLSAWVWIIFPFCFKFHRFPLEFTSFIHFLHSYCFSLFFALLFQCIFSYFEPGINNFCPADQIYFSLLLFDAVWINFPLCLISYCFPSRFYRFYSFIACHFFLALLPLVVSSIMVQIIFPCTSNLIVLPRDFTSTYYFLSLVSLPLFVVSFRV